MSRPGGPSSTCVTMSAYDRFGNGSCRSGPTSVMLPPGRLGNPGGSPAPAGGVLGTAPGPPLGSAGGAVGGATGTAIGGVASWGGGSKTLAAPNGEAGPSPAAG